MAYQAPIPGPVLRGYAYSIQFRAVTSQGRARLASTFDSWSAMQTAVLQKRAGMWKPEEVDSEEEY